MTTGLIYKHTSPSGNSYIGKSIDTMQERFNQHIKSAEKGDDYSFQCAIRKYGPENFTSEIVEDNILENLLNEKERYYIHFFDTYKKGYNMTEGGEGGDTFSKLSKEKQNKIKKIMSKTHKGKIVSQETRTKQSEVHKNKVIVTDGNTNFKVDLSDERIGVSLFTLGTKNYALYNEKDEFIEVCTSGLRKFCKDRNLPFDALRTGEPLYSTERGVNMAKKLNRESYVGWYLKSL